MGYVLLVPIGVNPYHQLNAIGCEVTVKTWRIVYVSPTGESNEVAISLDRC